MNVVELSTSAFVGMDILLLTMHKFCSFQELSKTEKGMGFSTRKVFMVSKVSFC